VVGAAGSVISLSGAVQGIIVAVAGLFMIIMGVNMLGMFPRLAGLLPRLPRGLSSRIVNSGSGRGPFIVGILNGFMPCGPLQSIQIYALGTGSALSGAISMFLFSLGTVPLMLGFGSITSILPPRFHGRILKVSALLVLILGSGMILRGMSLNGISLPGTGNFDVNSENVRIAELGEEGRQYVRTTMKASEYEPLIVQAGIPVVWTIEAAQEDLNGCNNPLTIPEYNIRFTMSPGENTIEFTPPMKEGTITYTCWMGMITSGIKVVESLADIDPSQIDDAAALSGESSGGCAGSSCCSSGGAGTGGSFSSLKSFPEIPTDEIGIARMVEGIQIVEISISETGFSPAVIVMEKGVETKWLIEGVNLNDSTYRLTFPALGNRGIEISEGTNALGLFPESDFSFYTWQYDFGGYVNVVEDIDMVELDIVKSTVRSYNKGESSF